MDYVFTLSVGLSTLLSVTFGNIDHFCIWRDIMAQDRALRVRISLFVSTTKLMF